MQKEIKAYPLNNTEYYAEDLKKWNYVRTTGVVSVDSNLRTISNNNMSVTVKPGIAFFNDGTGGISVWTDKDEVLQIDPADGVLNRIDVISLALDKTSNKTYLRVVKGVPSSTPTMPSLQRDNSIYEIFIAAISVKSGITAISSALVTDLRMNSNYCGLVRDGIERIPTEMIQNQYDELLQNLNKAIGDAGEINIIDNSVTSNKIMDKAITAGKLDNSVINLIFPVGIIREFGLDKNPNTIYPGTTWERFAEGRTTVGLKSGDTDFGAIGRVGGAKVHTLAINEMPAHSHPYYINIKHTDGVLVPSSETINSGLDIGGRRRYADKTENTGGNQAHNNLQPYIVVSKWIRTA